jgi:endonuclease YncB( thermonuclease family)
MHELHKVVDGDTWWMVLDLGFGVLDKIKVRLHGYDTPERHQPNYEEATKFASDALTGAQVVIVESYKDDRSFERWVCDVYVDGILLGDKLKEAGLLKP